MVTKRSPDLVWTIWVALTVLCSAHLYCVGVTGVNEDDGAAFGYRSPFDSTAIANERKLESGRSSLDKIERFASRSKLPRVGECWTDALESLRVSCASLDDEMQARLALSFTSCFSEMVGSPNYLCERTNPIKTCLSTLDSDGMDTFRQYFLHTQDMCYFIQSELWHQETDRAVNELQAVTFKMGRTVSEQKDVAESILESQYSSHKIQSEMLQENYQMFERVIHIKSALEEFGQQAIEQRLIFSEIYDKLQKMQKLVVWIQGEMSLIDLVSFYAIGVLFCYFLTTSERTHGARVWMILTLAVSLFVERCLYEFLAEYQMTHDEILSSIYYFRRVAVVWILGIWLIQYIRYRDYNAMNNNLLADLRVTMDVLMGKMDVQMKQSLQILQAHRLLGEAIRISGETGIPLTEDMYNSIAANPIAPHRVVEDIEKMQPILHNEGPKNSSVLFQYEMDSSDSEEEFEVADNSNDRNINNETPNLYLLDESDGEEEHEVKDREQLSTQSEGQGRMRTLSKIVNRLVGRPTSQKNDLHHTQTPKSQPTDQTKYHLRARENIHTPCRYTDLISKRRNSSATKAEVTSPANGYYSSDDEI